MSLFVPPSQPPPAFALVTLPPAELAELPLALVLMPPDPALWLAVEVPLPALASTRSNWFQSRAQATKPAEAAKSTAQLAGRVAPTERG
jgi:hypothetical protein